MRSAMSVVLCLGVLVACESSEQISPTAVIWMDWPAEVDAQTQFPVRLIVLPPCTWDSFGSGPSADQSAVTFEPFFLGVRQDILCAARASASMPLVVSGLDTTIAAPGLTSTSSPRSYEMRGAQLVETPTGLGWRIRTYGDVIVRPSGAAATRRNAGGSVWMEVDTLGCVRVRPVGAYGASASLVLENQSDTANLSGAFVRGYIYDAAAPVCGETRVFHLESRN